MHGVCWCRAAIWDIETYWIVKHESIGDAFFDAEVGEFFMEELWYSRKHGGEPCSRRCHGESRTAPGASVGPAWTEQLQRHGKMGEVSQPLHIETTCEVRNIMKDISSGKYWVDLSNGTRVCVDLVISAIGVDPTQNVSWVPSCVQRAFDGGLLVSKDMETSFRDVFAAGDACTVETEKDTPWFQMRLWSQARAMGQRAAHCMLGIQDQMASELAFDLFVHVTHFLGKRVILLGCFNGQTLDESASPIKFYSRVMNELPHRNFVRVVIQDGRMKGAICIGDTGLEETLENLIMDGIDVSAFGPDILDPDRGLEDIFD
jgi:NAD(P)H-nitrite reductase large subunit